jgi:hypothetical protein
MPTHKDFPDSYFAEPSDSYFAEPPQRSTRPSYPTRPTRPRPTLAPRQVLALVLVVVVAPLVVDAAVRKHVGQPSQAGALPGQGSGSGNTIFGPGKLLAIGTSAPLEEASPQLIAFSAPSGITIRSHSTMPVTVAISNGYGAPLEPWQSFGPDQDSSQTLITGRSYGYCFSQPSGAGYAGARGCGTLVMHTYLNGIQVPDGSPVAINVGFRPN